MPIQSELNKPADKVIACRICGEPLKVTHHWLVSRWLHPTCHDDCIKHWQIARDGQSTQEDFKPPEAFQGFEPEQFPHKEALNRIAEFTHKSALHTLAVIGVPHRGKSRLVWAAIQGFFDGLASDTGAKRWVDYFLFADLVTDFERAKIMELKASRYAFVDDVGSVECYGRERALLQAALRSRIQKGQWTFLCIDNIKFDPGLEDLLDKHAFDIYIDQ